MLIQKGTKLLINDIRKGSYLGEAARDFDTEKEEFYPIIAREYVSGMANEWFDGDEIPCRKGLAKISVMNKEQ